MKKSYPAKHFSPKDTLECGQVFRYIYDKKSDKYEVFSTNKHCYLSQKGDETVLECADEDFPYFEEYFDTARDYEAITEKLSAFPELADAVAYSGGLRILRQDLEETLFSFIVSANNNIKRIRVTIERLCRAAGTDMGGYYSFPTAAQLQKLTVNDFKDLGLGYRAEYIYETSRVFPCEKDRLTGYTNDDKIYKKLLSFQGVGPKVANCIMLFGLNRTSAYPVDTWIFKANRTEKLDTRKKVEQYYRNRYGALAGFAQQYIFYYARSNKTTDTLAIK